MPQAGRFLVGAPGYRECMSLWLWVAVGVAAYVVFVAAVLGMCRAAAEADRLDRRMYDRWARRTRPSRGIRPAA